jgi:toxin ParE1/3/4
VTRYGISRAAETDIVSILAWTEETFGSQATVRYERLIVAGIRDVAAEPFRLGSVDRPELGDGVRSWHLHGSRGHTPVGPLPRPRHFVIYRLDSDIVVFGRVLHDAMELARHMDSGRIWRWSASRRAQSPDE